MAPKATHDTAKPTRIAPSVVSNDGGCESEAMRGQKSRKSVAKSSTFNFTSDKGSLSHADIIKHPGADSSYPHTFSDDERRCREKGLRGHRTHLPGIIEWDREYVAGQRSDLDGVDLSIRQVIDGR